MAARRHLVIALGVLLALVFVAPGPAAAEQHRYRVHVSGMT